MKRISKQIGVGLTALSLSIGGVAVVASSPATAASSSGNTITVGTLYASTGSYAT